MIIGIDVCAKLLVGYNSRECYFQLLLKAFLPNLKSSLAVARRTAASSLVLICLHSRKPHFFYSYLLSALLGTFTTLQDNISESLCCMYVIHNYSEMIRTTPIQSHKYSEHVTYTCIYFSDIAIPEMDVTDVYPLLGALLTFRHLIPHVTTSLLEYRDAKKSKESLIPMKQIIQVRLISTSDQTKKVSTFVVESSFI